MIRRLAILAILLTLATLPARADGAPPAFVEDFASPDATLDGLLDRWWVTRRLDRKIWPERVAILADPARGKVVRIQVREGDAGSGATEAMLKERRRVCDETGSRAMQMEAEPNGVAPTERAEIEIRADRATGEGELIRFGRPVWYRFGFKLGQDWPRDVPVEGRIPCRTVIHQIKQNAALDGVDCEANPFFKIEARPLGDRARFFAQIVTGDACATPAKVKRTQICVRNDLPRDAWTMVNVRLLADGKDGRADIWLDGEHCGSYRGGMGDGEHGARRDGVPFVDQQPRFGIYRDWRAEPQTIYFERIMFWNADPAGHPGWGAAALPP